MTGLFRDFEYALRQLKKNPVFSAVAIGTLALGIGASTAIFSVVYGVLLRSLPYYNPDRIVQIWEVNSSGSHMQLPGEFRLSPVFEYTLRGTAIGASRRARSFAEMAVRLAMQGQRT